MLAEEQSAVSLRTQKGQALFTIQAPPDIALFSDILSRVAQAGINVDILSLSGGDSGAFSFSADGENKKAIRSLLHNEGAFLAVQDGLCKVTILGPGMEHNPGVAARVFALLSGLSVTPAVISTSEEKICFMVAESQLDAVQAALFDFCTTL
ncbi:ACT domain-containing protein [Eubacteriales bacterium OttesenSCG-928-M02]|nr:ACT domain-containing protein [Eubacteriales bacterium OttesenSCG-928-M02]